MIDIQKSRGYLPAGGAVFKHVRMGSFRTLVDGQGPRFLCTTGIGSCSAVVLAGTGMVGDWWRGDFERVHGCCIGHVQTADMNHGLSTLQAMIRQLRQDVGHRILRIDASIVKGNPSHRGLDLAPNPVNHGKLYDRLVSAFNTCRDIDADKVNNNDEGHHTAVYDLVNHVLYVHNEDLGAPVSEGSLPDRRLMWGNRDLFYDP